MTSLENAFEPSSRAAAAHGAEARQAAGGAGVRQPGHQRRLRAGHDQLDARRGRGRGEPFDVARVAASTVRVARDPRVAGRAQQLGLLRGARERAHDRVLAPAGSDDEDAQRARATR